MTDKDLDRFWAKVRKGDDDECWEWLGGFFTTGYPAFWISSKNQNVGGHRLMCELTHGEPEGRYSLHSCDNPSCVNPKHLRWGTPADNMRDRSERKRAPYGADHHKAKLTAGSVLQIRALADVGVGPSELGRRFGVTPQAISLVVKRKNWSHV